MNYVIGDFLTRIKNAYMAGKREVELPYSKSALAVGKVLKEEKYLKDIQEKDDKGKKYITAELLYMDRDPAILDIKIVSKPSLRRYITLKEIENVNREFGTSIISTNKGIMSARKAAKKKLGGELICSVQ